MSINTHTLTPEEAENGKRLTYLLDVLKALGWTTVIDTRVIKPNMRAAQLHLRKKAKKYQELFPNEDISWATLTKQEVVDKLNPLLIHYWHVQIIGNTGAASLQLIVKKNYT